jgi:hypothetical protein
MGLDHNKDFAQGQMRGQKATSQSTPSQPDDIKVLIDPALRLPVVEAVNKIQVDGRIGVSRMRAGVRSEKVAGK